MESQSWFINIHPKTTSAESWFGTSFDVYKNCPFVAGTDSLFLPFTNNNRGRRRRKKKNNLPLSVAYDLRQSERNWAPQQICFVAVEPCCFDIKYCRPHDKCRARKKCLYIFSGAETKRRVFCHKLSSGKKLFNIHSYMPLQFFCRLPSLSHSLASPQMLSTFATSSAIKIVRSMLKIRSHRDGKEWASYQPTRFVITISWFNLKKIANYSKCIWHRLLTCIKMLRSVRRVKQKANMCRH